MTYTCETCGQEFETLSQLRLHDCSSEALFNDEEESDHPSADSNESIEEKYPDLVGNLPPLVADAQTGDISALYQALAKYEQTMDKVIEQCVIPDDPMYSDLLFAYYKPLADAIELIAQSEGWGVLMELLAAYDIREEDECPSVSHVIVNGVGRMLIRTRHTAGIEDVPAEALDRLAAVPEVAEERLIREDSYAYGWGIGHPSYSVGDQLCATAPTHHKWTLHTLKAAFYADQRTAIDVFERIVTEQDLDGTANNLPYSVDLKRYYFGVFADFERDFISPPAPIEWKWEPIDDQSYELTPKVEQRVRALVAEHDIDEKLSADWTLADLDPTILSDFLKVVEEW